MTDYTIARYEYNLGGGEAHDFYALERLNPDGSSTRLAALHGMAIGDQIPATARSTGRGGACPSRPDSGRGHWPAPQA